MTVLPRVLAALGALALGLGGALVVAAPASAASLTVSSSVDDGLPGSLSYELSQLDPGVVNTINITVGGIITGPVAGFPTIFDDVVITSSAATRPMLLMNSGGGSLNVSGAGLTMTGIDIVSDTAPTPGGPTQGISVLDGSLSLNDVTVRDFDTNVFFWDQVGSQSLDLTDVSVGGTLAHPSDYGIAAQALDGPVTFTRVAATFTAQAGIGVSGGGGTVSLDSISASDGGGIVIGDDGGSTFVVNQVTTARTTGGVNFVAQNSDVTLTDVQVTDTAGIGLLVMALAPSDITATTLRVSRSDDSGIVFNAPDSTVTVSDVESHDNGLVPGCGCGGGGSGIELYADNSTIDLSDADSHDNAAQNGGGIYVGDATDNSVIAITDVTVTDNTATNDGGGVYLLYADTGSTVTVTRATVTDNIAAHNGGGIALGDVEDVGTAVTVTGSTITGNTSNAIAGPPAVSGGGGIDVEGVSSGAAVTVSSSTISGNTAADDGGGLQVVGVRDDGSSFSLSDSSVTSNTSGDFGAGVYLLRIGNGTSTATATIIRTTVDHNIASGYGGGIAINEPAAETAGLPTVLIDSSTVSNNVTPVGGGGIHIRRLDNGPPSLVAILNTTVTGNDAQLGGGVESAAGQYGAFGGPGVPYIPGPDLLVTLISHSTIANNSAHTSAGVIANGGDHTVKIENSILSGGTSNNGSTVDDFDPDATFTVTYSLIQEPRSGVVIPAGVGNLTGVSPALGPLALNGGSTLTRLVAPGSPAYNAGDPAFAGAGLLDQRGQARVFERLDMGAVEWHPALAITGTELTPGPPLVALLLLFAGLAMVAFSRLQLARSIH